MVGEMGKKIEDLVGSETGRVKEYMMNSNVADTRTMFRYRTKMLELKDNIKGIYGRDNLSCEACSSGEVESQSHVLSCTAYDSIRERLDMNNDKDLVAYFREVMHIRMKK